MNILYVASIDFYHKPNPSYHLMTAMLLSDMDKRFIKMFKEK